MQRRPARCLSSDPSFHRRGLTLLEVLIASAVFLGALTAILQITWTGDQARLTARLQSEAVIKAQSVLSEVIAGIQPLENVSDQVFPDSELGRWRYDISVLDTGTDGLLQLTVTAKHLINDDEANASFTIERYLRDPQLFIDAAMAAEE